MNVASKARTLFRWRPILAVGIGMIAAAGASFYIHYSMTDDVRFEDAAIRIVAACQESPYRPSCYDKELPKLMDEGFSMEDAFAITRLVQDRDPSYQYCHVLGHELSAKETAKDPDNWKSVIARAPIGVCSNGAIHGAFQERFRVESFAGKSVDDIVPELLGICEAHEDWNPTGMTEATCIHGLGHLTMYVTNGDVDASLSLCDRVVEENETNSKRQLCYDGVFMQIYQPLEPEDEALIAGQEVESKAELAAFCSRFTGAKYGSCVTEGWPLYLDVIDDPATAVDFCDRLDDGGWQHERCLSGLFFRAMAGANLSHDWARTYCPQVRAPYGDMCFANAAARMIETDDRNIEKAIALCETAAETDNEAGCYDKMLQYSSYNFVVGSPEFYTLCHGLPDKWQIKCLSQVPRTDLDGGNLGWPPMIL